MSLDDASGFEQTLAELRNRLLREQLTSRLLVARSRAEAARARWRVAWWRREKRRRAGVSGAPPAPARRTRARKRPEQSRLRVVR